MENTGRNDWLVSQSLERSLDIISAINTLSIHSKLELAGVADTTPTEQTAAARKTVKEFVITLGDLVKQATDSADQVTFGADPRLSSLARRFLVDHVQGGTLPLCDAAELGDLRHLLGQGDTVDHRLLAEELSHLRAVLEQHSQADAAIIFNEV
jgi:hypothetical protein